MRYIHTQTSILSLSVISTRAVAGLSVTSSLEDVDNETVNLSRSSEMASLLIEHCTLNVISFAANLRTDGS